MHDDTLQLERSGAIRSKARLLQARGTLQPMSGHWPGAPSVNAIVTIRPSHCIVIHIIQIGHVLGDRKMRYDRMQVGSPKGQELKF